MSVSQRKKSDNINYKFVINELVTNKCENLNNLISEINSSSWAKFKVLLYDDVNPVSGDMFKDSYERQLLIESTLSGILYNEMINSMKKDLINSLGFSVLHKTFLKLDKVLVQIAEGKNLFKNKGLWYKFLLNKSIYVVSVVLSRVFIFIFNNWDQFKVAGLYEKVGIELIKGVIDSYWLDYCKWSFKMNKLSIENDNKNFLDKYVFEDSGVLFEFEIGLNKVEFSNVFF